MKYAVKTYSQCDDLDRPAGVPLKWPWKSRQIHDSEIETYILGGWLIMEAEDFDLYLKTHQAEFDTWYENHSSPTSEFRLRVFDLVAPGFEHSHPSKIDFRRNLKPGINLQKTVLMGKNGRPVRAEYTYNGVKIAEIAFVFETDSFNFMTRRTEVLSYFNNMGEAPNSWPIHDQFYDANDPHHQVERINERVEARQAIMNEIKAKLDAFLFVVYQAQGMSYAQILAIGGAFWAEYQGYINAWYHTGTPEFKTAIAADAKFSFMNLEVPASHTGADADMSVRDYIQWRITY